MNTDSPNTGAKALFSCINSITQLFSGFSIISDLAGKYGFNFITTPAMKNILEHGLRYRGGNYWCHIDMQKRTIKFSPNDITKNVLLGECPTHAMLALCLEMYLNGHETLSNGMILISENDVIIENPDDMNLTTIVPNLCKAENGKYVFGQNWEPYYEEPVPLDGTIKKYYRQAEVIDPKIEYILVSNSFNLLAHIVHAETSLGWGYDSFFGTLVKKDYLEEILGCNFNEFCKRVPQKQMKNISGEGTKNMTSTETVSIANKIFDNSVFKQHTDLSVDLFLSMVKKISESVTIDSFCGHRLRRVNGNISISCNFMPSMNESIKVNTLEKSIVSILYHLPINDSSTLYKYKVYKEGIKIKIEKQ